MNQFYIQYSVIDFYGIGNVSVFYFLASSSFWSVTFVKIHPNQNALMHI